MVSGRFPREELRDGVRWRQAFESNRSKVAEKKTYNPFPESVFHRYETNSRKFISAKGHFEMFLESFIVFIFSLIFSQTISIYANINNAFPILTTYSSLSSSCNFRKLKLLSFFTFSKYFFRSRFARYLCLSAFKCDTGR
jgi:hypothetical protein